MVILENKNYRLATITKLTVEGFADEPLHYGLGIEKQCADVEHWYVIAFIKWDEHECACEVQTIGSRIFDIETDEWAIFTHLGKAAIELVQAAHIEYNSNN